MKDVLETLQTTLDGVCMASTDTQFTKVIVELVKQYKTKEEELTALQRESTQ